MQVHGRFVFVVHVCISMLLIPLTSSYYGMTYRDKHIYTGNSDYTTSMGLAQARPNYDVITYDHTLLLSPGIFYPVGRV